MNDERRVGSLRKLRRKRSRQSAMAMHYVDVSDAASDGLRASGNNGIINDDDATRSKALDEIRRGWGYQENPMAFRDHEASFGLTYSVTSASNEIGMDVHNRERSRIGFRGPLVERGSSSGPKILHLRTSRDGRLG